MRRRRKRRRRTRTTRTRRRRRSRRRAMVVVGTSKNHSAMASAKWNREQARPSRRVSRSLPAGSPDERVSVEEFRVWGLSLGT